MVRAPARYGKADTVSRYFRRLTHAGLWQKLLHALAEAAPNHPLRQLEEKFSAPAAARTASSACPSSCSSAASTCAAPCPARPGCCPIRFCPKPWPA
ncbi:hypothetical protein ACFQU7_20405 [Pseudoroseomonas wenyumeiae]